MCIRDRDVGVVVSTLSVAGDVFTEGCGVFSITFDEDFSTSFEVGVIGLTTFVVVVGGGDGGMSKKLNRI